MATEVTEERCTRVCVGGNVRQACREPMLSTEQSVKQMLSLGKIIIIIIISIIMIIITIIFPICSFLKIRVLLPLSSSSCNSI